MLILLSASGALAHDRTVSYSSIDVDGTRARITVRLAPLDVTALPWAASAGSQLDRQLGTYLSERLVVRAAGQPCAVTAPPARLATAADRIAISWEVTCPSPRAWQVRSDILRDVAPSHLHFARLKRGADAFTLEHVLTEAEPVWSIGDVGNGGAAHGESFAAYVWLGIEHILTGYDHLVFLLGLLLLGGTLRDVVRIVTGFTVAHSLTLALAVFGVLRPAQAPIEALIGLSIALIAGENLWLAGGRHPATRWAISAALACIAIAALRGRGSVPALTLAGVALFATCYFGLLARAERPAQLRAAVAFLFGLVHGFGFADVLLAAEIPTERLANALFGFNAGVELGQLAAVLALWSLLLIAARRRGVRLQRDVIEYGSAAILAAGVFWFVTRSYG